MIAQQASWATMCARRTLTMCFLIWTAVATITVLSNGAPTAVNDEAVTNQNTPVLIPVLGNDTGTGISIQSVAAPMHGTTEIVGDQIRYTPEPEYCGPDSFTYTIIDAALLTDTATVTVTVHCVNRPPLAEYKTLMTMVDRPIAFTLRATDPDIDPDNPTAHPLSFTILSGPKHGALDVDLTAVSYEPPHTAYVSAVYTPNPGFEGLDTIGFMVSDPFGAVSTSAVDIEVARQIIPLGSFSGTWRSVLTFRGVPTTISRFDSTLTGYYRVNGYNFQARATIANFDFNSFNLIGNLPVGLLSIRSTLQFDPRIPAFQYWQNLTRFDLFGAAWSHTFHLTGVEDTSYHQLAGTWTVDGYSFSSSTQFQGITLGFVSQLLSVRWRWDLCELPVEARLSFTKAGFQSLRVLLRDILIPCPACSYLRLYLDVDTTYTVDSKTVIPALKLRSDWECCVRGYFDLDSGASGHEFLGLQFYGFEIRLTLDGGIEFRSATSFVYERNAAVTGFSEYFEVWTIRGPILPCCGAPGWWQISTYFDEIPQLFGWGMTTAAAEIPVGNVLRAFTQVTVRANPTPWQWEWQVGGTLRF